jgi:hypothetical protein
MDTLTKPARVLGLMGYLDELGIINTPNTINNNWFLSNMSDSGWKCGPLFIFIFLLLPFLILLIHRVTRFRAFLVKKMKWNKTLQVKKVKMILLVKKEKDQHEVDALGGKCLQMKH